MQASVKERSESNVLGLEDEHEFVGIGMYGILSDSESDRARSSPNV
jgi:hypothetical protein